ncbi:uncharacterized protein (TIGR02594 family) [Pedobacter cryoconitis]|uniref:Uncharacterized protein (TIGR02594 family) n=1 Tax=Pedobacter cryoconitis TaxID=188932 RepID=A0A7W8ZMJ9_9SPHI|nr:TIGR02594 family protein [Pedobacter cryoconitis]MBB5636754.1 uncharacterized protein (TIGR02594 family) [Pedobacter cryoconitis]
MKTLPQKFTWLDSFKSPRIWVEARRHYGLLEIPGKDSNPNILAWAKEVGVSGWYTNDDIPWCGLFVGVCVQRAGYKTVGSKLLAALEWSKWGIEVGKGQEGFNDILVFKRPGGGHVGFYCGENDKAFLVYGGNQSNAVGLAWIEKTRLVACRRVAFKNKPETVKKIRLSDSGAFSENEV